MFKIDRSSGNIGRKPTSLSEHNFTSNMKLDKILVTDDHTNSSIKVIKEIIQSRNQEEAFYVLDVGDVVKKHRKWLSMMPRVEPHFAIKCNPDPTVIKVLATLNASFDCASQGEIEQVLAAGVSADRIIFANTVKIHSHIKYAWQMGVKNMTVDGVEELYKIKSIFPEANVIIRYRCDAKIAGVELGSKHGCDVTKEAPELIRLVKSLGLNLHGFSFHVGSQCGETAAYSRGIRLALDLIKYAESLGIENVKLIDIGGGFPGETGFSIDAFADDINKALETVDPSIRVISEPGRYYVGSAFTLASLVFGKRSIPEEKTTRHMYYMNDGVFGSFLDSIIAKPNRQLTLLMKPATEEVLYPSTIWGPTLDTNDCVIPDQLLPELHIGDWLIWPNMGAYTLSLGGNFNGLPLPAVYSYIKRNVWNSLNIERDASEKNETILKTENNERMREKEK
ncbi:ornithine decarboxylase 2-like isoform X1 [Athalia rosae]|uniref:ornithine decarboxylase 2-like isoform X1 n=2 Tax=Athalia rosae TaxID=37344 RepID=UPI002034275F|nr:ornithine decarboxylase 2-like isoform X1 [Athalia rosae]XP_012266301.2 ornithine decarboxylase 2-like isoform X1 [Athalia rosae]XP_048505224.1 ornithine decarboxylase 2-like isoform X1 [Athalia rosae]